MAADIRDQFTHHQQVVYQEAQQLLGSYPGLFDEVAPLVQQRILAGDSLQRVYELAVGSRQAQQWGAAHPNGTTGAGVPGPTGAAAQPGTSSGGSDQNDAFAQIQQVLNGYGLGSLASWAWGEIVAGKSQSQIVLDLYQTPEFNARFPAIKQRQQAGLPPISPADYLNYEDQATQMMRAAGLPSGFWDNPADFTKFIAGDVSLQELSDRVGLATQAAYQAPKQVLDAFQRDFGVGPGGLAAYFLDPSRAEPLLKQQFAAAQVGGAGTLSGYGTDTALDMRLANEGVSMQQALAGFSDLGLKKELFNPLPGENGPKVSQDQQVAAEFEGNAADQALINRVAAQRKARFNGGGGFVQSQQGIVGVGVAQ